MHYTEKCPVCGGSSVIIPVMNGVQRLCCDAAPEAQATLRTPTVTRELVAA